MSSNKILYRAVSTRLQHNTAALLFCTPFIAVSANVQAQQPNSNEIYRFAPIIVNSQAAVDDDANSIVAHELSVGGKVATSILDTPASVSVITEKEIEQRKASTTEEILQYTPGVITDFYGTDDRNDYFQIRGFQATTYRDGLTLGSMRGVREDAYAFERVEVIRGANSTLFGPADPGGSVNFVSKRPKFEEFGNAYATYGSFNHKEVGLDIGDTLNEDSTVAYRLTGKIKDSDREYDYSKDNSGFLMGGLTWEPSDFTSATLLIDYLNTDSTPNSGGYPMDKEYDRSNFYGEPNFNYHDVERTSVTGMLTHDFDNGLVLRGNLRYSDLTDDFGYIYLADDSSTVGIDRSYFGTNGEAQELIGNAILQYDARFDRIDSSTLVGVEYRDASTTDTSFFGGATTINISNPTYSGVPSSLNIYRGNDQDYTTKSIFVQQNLSFDEKFIVTTGLRNDTLDISSTDITNVTASDDFSETSLRGALTYKLNEEMSTYISMVESIAPPTIGVQPERGKQYEIGFKFSPVNGNALYSVAIYDLSKDDVTIAVTQENGSIERETIGESNVQGIDFESKVELTSSLSLTGGYSYMKSEVVSGTLRDGSSIEGKEFTTTPRQMASLWGHYTLPSMNMSVGLGMRYIDSYFFDVGNTKSSDSATLFDTSLTYQLDKATDLNLNVRNLLNEQHVVGSATTDYYNPGREITATLNYNF